MGDAPDASDATARLISEMQAKMAQLEEQQATKLAQMEEKLAAQSAALEEHKKTHVLALLPK